MPDKPRTRRDFSNNERLLLDIVRRQQPIARAAVTGLTDLTQQSVHRLLEGLIGDGLVQSERAKPIGRGKPSPHLSLAAGAVHAVGVSINTDSMIINLVDFNCRTVVEKRLRGPLSDRKAGIVKLRATLDEMIAESGVDRRSLCGLGLSMAGFFVDGERAMNAPEPLQDWSLVPLEPEFRAAFELPVYVENNATAGAIGESLSGVGRWYETFAYLSFNYGFGGGVIIDGRPYLGRHGNAGEFSGIYTQDESTKRPALRSLIEILDARGVAVEGVADLRERFDPSWPGVAEWIEMVSPQLDRMVNTVSAVLDPEAIVFGGELPAALGELLIASARFEGEHRYGVGMPRPKLIMGQSPGDPAATGAALLPLKYLYFR
ncbi:ROK family protein [Devosia nitrariae]|nr:ROK family protein [Devosia nitrariae]